MALAALSINNPVLGFRLDPGEPGLLSSAPASQAALRVTAQEQRNLRRLESEAIMAGRVILASGTSFGRAFAGPYLTITSGLTTVVSRPARPSVVESEAAREAAAGDAPEAPAAAPVEPQAPEAGAPEAAAYAPPAKKPDQELAAEEADLRIELRRLESPGFGPPLDQPPPETDPLRPLEEAAEQARSGRDGRIREVEGQLRKVQFERLLRQMGRSA